MDYPEINVKRLTGDEPVLEPGRDDSVCTVAEYWRWAHSNLFDNTERGVFAEYLVARALGCDSRIRWEWEPYDLLYQDDSVRFTVEVKSAAYLQSWQQDKLSRISFSIAPTLLRNGKAGGFAGKSSRQADIYVFCLFAHRDPESADPLDISQWEFRILPTETLNREFPTQRRISLSVLDSAGAVRSEYGALRENLIRAVIESRSGSPE